MRFARNVFDDLVERRLAPVAALLLLALVAVPLALSKSMPKDTAALAPPAPAGVDLSVPAMQPVVALASPEGRARLERLQALNPFQQRHAPVVRRVKAATSPSGAPTTGATPGASKPSSTSPTAGGGGTSSPSPTPTTAPAPHAAPAAPHKPRAHYVTFVDARFGGIGHTHSQGSLARLSPVPSRGTPVLIYLGLQSDRKTAVFLVSSDAHAEGDGRCVPSPRDCQTLRMQAGQSEFLDVTQANGATAQYELDVVRIGRRRVASARAAHHSLARVSRRGRAALRHVAAFRGTTELHALRYDGRTGRLFRVRRVTRSR
ncbi:MAG: hypothetical protein QOK31_190 [Solirubrobacteraceae bacterium]|nr:hypothetical protein [Solirubrobacteraceae bacterium]